LCCEVLQTFVLAGTAVYVTGAFKSAAGQDRDGFAAFDSTTGTLRPWNPSSTAWKPYFTGAEEMAASDTALAVGRFGVVHVFTPLP